LVCWGPHFDLSCETLTVRTEVQRMSEKITQRVSLTAEPSRDNLVMMDPRGPFWHLEASFTLHGSRRLPTLPTE